MKRIAIDMDEVMADFKGKYLPLFGHAFGGRLTAEDLRGVKLMDIRPELRSESRRYIEDPTFFRDLAVMPHAQEVIAELSQHYEIFITTAAMEVPASFTAKYEWLKEHFGFLNEMNFVFCGDKSIVNADYLIDDNASHFKRFCGQGILFTAHHNVAETEYVRVDDWLAVRAYFRRLLEEERGQASEREVSDLKLG